MKKRMIGTRLMTAVLMILVCLGLAGCSGGNQAGESNGRKEEVRKPAVAFVTGRIANSRPIDSSAPMLQDTMIDCAENYGYVFMVRTDGEPELVLQEDLDIEEQFKSASRERLHRDAVIKATSLLEYLDGVTAEYPEVDYLEAIRLAANCLQDLKEDYTSLSIICCGSGLSTEGYMDFQNNLLYADPAWVVEALKERETLPDLQGITVYWLGMGQVIEPQDKVTPKQSKNLEAVWQAVVEASGGEFVANDFITVTEEKDFTEELPSVSTVEIPSDDPIEFDPKGLETAEEKGGEAFKEPQILTEEKVGFVPDSADYLDSESAVKVIKPIAEYLLKNDSVELLLIGTTAGDVTDETSLRLSRERAEAVRKTLIDLGVESERVTAVGLGSDDPWHIRGAGYEGPAALSNRKVVLVDTRTETARKIMNR